MEMNGEQRIAATQRQTWEALNDPAVLKQCVPGCESIEPTGENQYQVLMVARVGPVSARFKGKLTLSDIVAPDSYSIAFEGQGGAAGFAKGGAQVRLSPEGDGTRLSYAVKANVGGKLAQIGSRLVDAAARKVADDFFRNFNARVEEMHRKEPPPGEVLDPAHHPEAQPVEPDPDMPSVSERTLVTFAAGSLLLTALALLTLLG